MMLTFLQGSAVWTALGPQGPSDLQGPPSLGIMHMNGPPHEYPPPPPICVSNCPDSHCLYQANISTLLPVSHGGHMTHFLKTGSNYGDVSQTDTGGRSQIYIQLSGRYPCDYILYYIYYILIVSVEHLFNMFVFLRLNLHMNQTQSYSLWCKQHKTEIAHAVTWEFNFLVV